MNKTPEELIDYAKIQAAGGLAIGPMTTRRLIAMLERLQQQNAELQEQKDKWAAWAIALGAKADELESRPLCVTDEFLDELDTLVALCRTHSMCSNEKYAPQTEQRCLAAQNKIATIRAAGGSVDGSE